MSTPPAIRDYQLEERIGEGAFGEVWRGLDYTGQPRAIKVLTLTALGGRTGADRELAGVKRIQALGTGHPNLCPILHVGQTDDGRIYYVMPLADNTAGERYVADTLKARLLAGRVPLGVALDWCAQIAEALEFLHRHQLVHRDVKPANIVFRAGVPLLADVGLVRLDADEVSALAGTPAYMAPELKGGVGGDVFALGKVLYELVTGLGPGQFPEIPEELLAADQFRMANDVIACACAPNPRDRYPTALAMAAALRRACTVQPKRVHGGLILGAVMLALLAVLLLASAYTKESNAPLAKATWTNSLGMRFVPLVGESTLMSMWETRVRDFAAFVESQGYNADSGLLVWTPNGWRESGETWRHPGFEQTQDHPVVGMSWHDARAFCDWLTEREHTAGTLALGRRYRLPTNVEWDQAVGNATYPWGESWPPPTEAGNYAGDEAAGQGNPIYAGHRDAYVFTAPVGSFPANRLGLFDLGGNAWEWTDEGVSRSGPHETLRGAGWLHDARPAPASAHRHNGLRDGRYSTTGFRVVCAPTQ